jgi:hypothetical protein
VSFQKNLRFILADVPRVQGNLHTHGLIGFIASHPQAKINPAELSASPQSSVAKAPRKIQS